MAAMPSSSMPTVTNSASPVPAAVEHPERPVAGVDQVGGGLDDAAQHDREAELGPQRHDGVEEAT